MPLQYAFDFEITNRCNADCTFCPRDATPHQGLMSDEVFERALLIADDVRAVCREIDPSSDVAINLCGFGEPLLHKRTPHFARRVRDEGFRCTMGSNAALLDDRRANAILDAGVQRVFINAGERGADYEEVYSLPWEKTKQRILRFIELAEGRCKVAVVLVDHRGDRARVDDMERFWRDHGVTEFVRFEVHNRGGALHIDHMQYDDLQAEIARARSMFEARGAEPVCGHPFWQTFVGYDGNIYLCCGDWEKRAPVGSVFDGESVITLSNRLGPVRSREPVCRSCNMDPLNILAQELRASDEGQSGTEDVEHHIDQFATSSSQLVHEIDEFEETARRIGKLTRKRIPVRAL